MWMAEPMFDDSTTDSNFQSESSSDYIVETDDSSDEENRSEVILWDPEIILQIEIMYKECTTTLEMMKKVDPRIEYYIEKYQLPKDPEYLKVFQNYKDHYSVLYREMFKLLKLIQIINYNDEQGAFRGTKRKLNRLFEEYDEKMVQVKNAIKMRNSFTNKCN